MQKFNSILPVPVLAEPQTIPHERQAREGTENCDRMDKGGSMADSRGGQKLTWGEKGRGGANVLLFLAVARLAQLFNETACPVFRGGRGRGGFSSRRI